MVLGFSLSLDHGHRVALFDGGALQGCLRSTGELRGLAVSARHFLVFSFSHTHLQLYQYTYFLFLEFVVKLQNVIIIFKMQINRI